MKRLILLLLATLLLTGGAQITTFAQDTDTYKTLDLGEKFSFAWSPNQEPDLAGYRIYMRTPSATYDFGPGKEYAAVGVMAEPASGPHAISTVGVYHFVVTAFDTEGLESGPSEEATANIVNLPPGAPTGCAIRKFTF